MKIKRKMLSIIGLMLISTLLLSEFSIALNISLGKDSEKDMLIFETNELNDIIDTMNATELNISTLNLAYNNIKDSKLSNKTEKPSFNDIIDIEFDLENFNLSIEMRNDLDFSDNDFIIGVIWNSETHYTFLLSDYGSIYSANDSFEFFEIEITDNKFELENLTETFDSKDYVKGILFYVDLDNPNIIVVELYDNLFSFELLIFLFWFIIGIIIIVILAIVLIAYLNNESE